jgi:hypothetical protein
LSNTHTGTPGAALSRPCPACCLRGRLREGEPPSPPALGSCARPSCSGSSAVRSITCTGACASVPAGCALCAASAACAAGGSDESIGCGCSSVHVVRPSRFGTANLSVGFRAEFRSGKVVLVRLCVHLESHIVPGTWSDAHTGARMEQNSISAWLLPHKQRCTTCAAQLA